MISEGYWPIGFFTSWVEECLMESHAKIDMPIPESFNVRETVDGLEISWNWFSWVYFLLIFLCIIWFGSLVVWYAAFFGASFEVSDPARRWLFVLFPLLHVCAGSVFLYSTICGFVNQTTITFSTAWLSIKHHPLPWFGNMQILTGEIKQLFVKQKIHRFKNQANLAYVLYAVDTLGKCRKLINNAGEEETQYLEYILEKRMGIKNTTIEGEYKK